MTWPARLIRRGQMNEVARIIALALMLTAGISSGGLSQTTVTLAALTVPEKNLPSGCRLKPFVPPTKPVISDGRVNPGSAFPFPSNPWVGTDRRLLIQTRTSIDGPLKLPDAPPMTRKEVVALEHQWVANAVEGYRAEYVSAEEAIVRVAAIRYDDAKFATSSTSGESTHTRIVLGPMVVQVWADSRTACLQTILAHIRSLK